MAKNKIVYIIAAGVVLIAVAGSLFWFMQNQNGNTNSSRSNAQKTSSNALPKSNSPTNALSQNSLTKPSASLSYADAIKIYINRRLQFSVNSSNYCSMVPYTIAFQNGTNVMLDNRNSKTLTIYLDGQPYSMKAYSFKVVALKTSAKLPHIVRVDCGAGKNNGSILLR